MAASLIDLDRLAEAPREVEADPAGAEVARLGDRPAVQDRARGSRSTPPRSASPRSPRLHRLHHLARGHGRAGVDLDRGFRPVASTLTCVPPTSIDQDLHAACPGRAVPAAHVRGHAVGLGRPPGARARTRGPASVAEDRLDDLPRGLDARPARANSVGVAVHRVAEQPLVGVHLVAARVVHDARARSARPTICSPGCLTRAPSAIVTSGLSRKRT